jgi:hypothetical protein
MNKSAEQSADSILWVVGDEEIQRYVFEQHGFGYWSACFDILLEKHGLLSFQRGPLSVLDDYESLSRYEMLIVSWIPASFWKESWLRNIVKFCGVVFLEGPFPPIVAFHLGLQKDTECKDPPQETHLIMRDPHLADRVCKKNSPTIHERDFTWAEKLSDTSIRLSPKKVFTKAPEPYRQELAISDKHSLTKRLEATALSHLLAYNNRFQKNGRFFEDQKFNGLAFLFLLIALEKLTRGSYRRRCLQIVQDGLNAVSTHSDFAAVNQIGTAAVFACALAQGSTVLDSEKFASKSRGLLEDILRGFKQLKNPPAIVSAWILAGAAIQSRDEFSDPAREMIENLAHRFEVLLDGGELFTAADVLWTLAFASRHLETASPELSVALQNAIVKKLHPLTRFVDDRLAPGLENRHIWELLLLGGAGQLIGAHEDTDALLAFCFSQAFDPEIGFFRSARVRDGALRLNAGHQSNPWSALGIISAVSGIQLQDNSRFLKEYEAAQISAWEKPPYHLESYRAAECDTLAHIRIENQESVALFQKENIAGSTFQLLSYLVHYHTLHPVDAALLDCPSSHILILEEILFKLLEKHAVNCAVPQLKVAPWPWGKKYCLTVRHDVDRIPDENLFRRLLALEKDLELGVSWYWIPGRADKDLINGTEDAGHENGLHAMRLERKIKEKAEIEKHFTDRKVVHGENWHGGGGGDYWIGQPSVKAAIEAGMAYTELMPTIYDFPYAGFPALDRKGRLYSNRIVGLTHTCCVDAGTRKGVGIYKLEWMLELAQNGYFCMLLNHPDVNFETFQQWVSALPQKGRLDWNCSQVAQWWRATHTKEGLNIRGVANQEGQFSYELLAKETITDLELNFIYPAHQITEVIVDTGGDKYTPEWQKDDGNAITVVRIRLNLTSDIPSRLNIVISKPQN